MHQQEVFNVCGIKIAEWTLAIELNGQVVSFCLTDAASDVCEFASEMLNWQISISRTDGELRLHATCLGQGDVRHTQQNLTVPVSPNSVENF